MGKSINITEQPLINKLERVTFYDVFYDNLSVWQYSQGSGGIPKKWKEEMNTWDISEPSFVHSGTSIDKELWMVNNNKTNPGSSIWTPGFIPFCKNTQKYSFLMLHQLYPGFCLYKLDEVWISVAGTG